MRIDCLCMDFPRCAVQTLACVSGLRAIGRYCLCGALLPFEIDPLGRQRPEVRMRLLKYGRRY